MYSLKGVIAINLCHARLASHGLMCFAVGLPYPTSDFISEQLADALLSVQSACNKKRELKL